MKQASDKLLFLKSKILKELFHGPPKKQNNKPNQNTLLTERFYKWDNKNTLDPKQFETNNRSIFDVDPIMF